MENQRLQSMCNQLTNLVKSLTFAQKMQRAISPTSKVAPRSISSRKNIQRLNSLKSQTKKSTTDASPNARKTKHSNSYSFSNSALDKKVTFKEESDPRNSEVHITAEGLKVIDFHPDEDPCLMNKELKDYERENRHRYVPRILTKKNQLMQDKIDKDIEECLQIARNRLKQRTNHLQNDRWEFKSHHKEEKYMPDPSVVPRQEGWVFDWVLHKTGNHGVASKHYYRHH